MSGLEGRGLDKIQASQPERSDVTPLVSPRSVRRPRLSCIWTQSGAVPSHNATVALVAFIINMSLSRSTWSALGTSNSRRTSLASFISCFAKSGSILVARADVPVEASRKSASQSDHSLVVIERAARNSSLAAIASRRPAAWRSSDIRTARRSWRIVNHRTTPVAAPPMRPPTTPSSPYCHHQSRSLGFNDAGASRIGPPAGATLGGVGVEDGVGVARTKRAARVTPRTVCADRWRVRRTREVAIR